jgi:hypothetical protein
VLTENGRRIAWPGSDQALQLLTFETFAPHLNTTFALKLGESSIDLTLTGADKKPVQAFRGMMREPFALYFRSASQVVLPQRIYPFVHADMGRFELFIVPIAREPEGIVYEAVFN